jgi:hypothetical protein
MVCLRRLRQCFQATLDHRMLIAHDMINTHVSDIIAASNARSPL